MEEYNKRVMHVANCDNIYCPFYFEADINHEECIECFNEEQEQLRQEKEVY